MAHDRAHDHDRDRAHDRARDGDCDHDRARSRDRATGSAPAPGRGVLLVQRVSATRAFARTAPHVVPVLDRAVHRLTRGKVLFSARMLPGLVLTVPGARTGRPRTTPLACMPEGKVEGAWILVGSNFGRTGHPAWTANLLARPDEAVVNWRGRDIPYARPCWRARSGPGCGRRRSCSGRRTRRTSGGWSGRSGCSGWSAGRGWAGRDPPRVRRRRTARWVRGRSAAGETGRGGRGRRGRRGHPAAGAYGTDRSPRPGPLTSSASCR